MICINTIMILIIKLCSKPLDHLLQNHATTYKSNLTVMMKIEATYLYGAFMEYVCTVSLIVNKS